MQYIQLQGQQSSRLDTPLEEGSFNLFIDSNDGAIKAKDSEGNITSAGGGGLVETTYTELYGLWDDAALTPGTYYKITNFRTCYDQPNYDVNGFTITTGNYKTGSLSPIIVLALDSGSLAADAFQPEHPNDNIKYDISFNQTEVTSNPAFGRIIYRKDERGNVMDYDFREVRFKRYDVYVSDSIYDGTISLSMTGSAGFITGSGTSFTNTFASESIVGILDTNNNPLVSYYAVLQVLGDHGMVVTGSTIHTVSNKRLVNARSRAGLSWKQNNILSNTNEYEYLTFQATNCFNNVSTNNIEYTKWSEDLDNTFLLPNNVFRDGSYLNNSFARDFRNNTFDDDFDSNTITDQFYNNSIYDDFDNNTISAPFYDNIIDCNFQHNLIMDSFYNNNLGDDDGIDVDNNTFKGNFNNNFYSGYNDMSYNTFNKDFSGNIINRSFRDNTFYYAYNNVFAAEFNDNKIGDGFYDNVINESFYDNIIGSDFYGNTIATPNENNGSFQHNVIGNNFYNNTIGSNFSYNQIRNFFFDNTIASDFGFGGGNYRGNVIGNNFNNNTIGEYFYDNNIGDNFEYNTIGDYFQFNRVEAAIGYTDFTEYYGNLISVSFSNGIAGTDGTYSNVTQTSTSGIGVNAEFEIIVTGNTVTTVNVTNGGKLYREGDTITIASGSFGGTNNLVLTEDALSLVPEVYRNYNKNIQRAANGNAVLTAIFTGEGYYPFITEFITQAID